MECPALTSEGGVRVFTHDSRQKTVVPTCLQGGMWEASSNGRSRKEKGGIDSCQVLVVRAFLMFERLRKKRVLLSYVRIQRADETQQKDIHATTAVYAYPIPLLHGCHHITYERTSMRAQRRRDYIRLRSPASCSCSVI